MSAIRISGRQTQTGIWMDRAKSYIHRFRRKLLKETSIGFWTRYTVTLNRSFENVDESLAYFHWRNDQYYDYIKLMPVSGQKGKEVLDFGCGPGNDLVGFHVYSNPARLIGVEVSPTALVQAKRRMAVHKANPELILMGEDDIKLPIPDTSVDYIHSSGVLHHVRDPLPVLQEFRRILRPSGEARVMVYNYNSLWLHLHVAYLVRRVEKLYTNIPIREAFGRFTDGEECPFSTCYKAEEWASLANRAGFDCTYLGAAMAVRELDDFPMRCSAIMSSELEEEHRRFLIGLHLDKRGLPLFGDTLAGISGCYKLRPA
jgi:SAM-dependent methyltransferase